MSINSVVSLAYTKYTKNENPYLACNTGKKVGAAVGATAAGVGTALALKNGSLMNMANTTLAKVSTGSGKIAQIVAKYPKFFKYGLAGISFGLATATLIGVGKLIGHGVDKIVENKRAKEADAQAEQLNCVA